MELLKKTSQKPPDQFQPN